MVAPQSTTDDRRIGPIIQAYGEDGILREYILSGFIALNADGTNAPSGSSTSPVFVNAAPGAGSASIATSQSPSSASSATALSIVAARAGRISVTLTNITGSAAAYLGPTGVTTATGFFLAAVPGAAVTLYTSAAVFGVSPGTAQNFAVVETF